MTHHLYIALRAHHPKSNHLSLYTCPPLPFSKQPPQYLFLRLLPYCFLCLWGFVCLSYLFTNYFQFFIPHRSEIIWFLTCFVLFHIARLFSRLIRGSILSFLWLSSIPLYTPLLLGLKPQASMQASLWGKPSEESRDSGWLDRGLPGSQAHSLLCTVWHLTVQPAVLGLAGE